MPEEVAVVAAENRRLLQEVKELRARVAALESSRWWRLHPRFLVARVTRLGRKDTSSLVARSHQESVAPVAPAEIDEALRPFREDVLERGSFRSDMVSWNLPRWEPFLRALDGRNAHILEIGSFEGMSACYFLWRLRDAHVTCIDTFAGGASFTALGADVGGLEATFDANVALVDSSRIRKLVGKSADWLPQLLQEGEQFELVFVDGSDLALDVLIDAALSWQLLAPGGIMIFDNYLWRSPLGEDPLFQPAPAVDAFLELVRNHCDVLVKSNQVILRRSGASQPEVAHAAALASAQR